MVHLASLLLLLASLSAAERSVLRDSDLTMGGHYIAALLAQDFAGIRSQAAIPLIAAVAHDLNPPAASVAHLRTVWTMRPPAKHCVEIQAATGFGV